MVSDVIEARPAGIVDEGLVSAALGDSFLLRNFAVPLPVDPEVEPGHVVVVNLQGDSRLGSNRAPGRAKALRSPIRRAIASG